MQEEHTPIQIYFTCRDRIIESLMQTHKDELPVVREAMVKIKSSINRDWDANKPLSREAHQKISSHIQQLKKVNGRDAAKLQADFNILYSVNKEVFQTLSEDFFSTYPTKEGYVNTPASQRICSEVQKDIYKGHSRPILFNDLTRGYLINGQDISQRVQDFDNPWQQMKYVLEQADKLCDIAPNDIQPIYQLTTDLIQDIEGLLVGENPEDRALHNNLANLPIKFCYESNELIQHRLLQQAGDHLETLGFSRKHKIMQKFQQLASLRHDFQQNHAQQEPQRLYVLHCSAQYICNAYLMYTTFGTQKPGEEIPPSVMRAGTYEPLMPTTPPTCNMTRMGYLQLLDADSDATINSKLEGSKPGTYLLVKSTEQSDNAWRLLYRQGNGKNLELSINQIDGLPTVLNSIKHLPAGQINADIQYELQKILTADHERNQRPEGELTIHVDQENRRLQSGMSTYVLNSQGELEPTDSGFDYTRDEANRDPALKISLEVRLEVHQGQPKPIITYQKIEPLTQSIIHAPQVLKEPDEPKPQHADKPTGRF